ncbi:MAG: FAD-dependent oxidoreductase [Streptosporangiales bacterium]|nr:FAD-dependent oxidoreductase [Streptosporangiales bacterium]
MRSSGDDNGGRDRPAHNDRLARSSSRWISEPARRTPVADESEVLVVGGGPAGVAAAIAAARSGARTTLVERAAFLGGTATGAMVASFMGFFWRDRRVTGGIGYEITRRLIDAGGAGDFMKYVMGEAAGHPFDVRTFPFDPEILKVVLDDAVRDCGIHLLLHTQVLEPVLENEKVVGATVQGRGDRKAVLAPTVIDASGDGLVVRKAGAEVEDTDGDPRSRQPMTLVARLVKVDVQRFRALPRQEKQRLVEKGYASGELALKILSLVSSPTGDDAFMLISRVSGWDGSDEAELTQAEMEGRRQVLSAIKFLRREVPGFEECSLTAMAPWIGVRETWRIVGDYMLTGEDVMAGRQFPDAVLQGGGPLDVHHPKGGDLTLAEPSSPFSVPYSCLLPRGLDGLLVAGRCASATGEAMGALRHMGPSMALGHAAGVAAALGAKRGRLPRDVDPGEVRDMLRSQDAIIDPLVPVEA